MSGWKLLEKILNEGKSCIKRISELLESMESQKIVAWKEIGYNESEIEMLREANAILSVKDKKTWHTDKKIARKLMKEARESLNKRLND